MCEVLIRLNAVKPRKAIGRNVRELSSLEALTKMTLERRQEMRNRENKKNEIHLPSISQKEGTTSLPSERHRRKTLCYGMFNYESLPEGTSCANLVTTMID